MTKPFVAADFSALVATIAGIHHSLAEQAARAVNISLTLRNWLIGVYIREYGQKGSDRVPFGEALLERLSQTLAETGKLAITHANCATAVRFI
ncbi:hypothetical protein GO003_020530 [Methylicorpusculum oleiharenae]|uniref:hypothetical protein n=1 Tax=Methylicorpusculum oleiharenae TaxID=1338687 RepID=UPI00135A08D1|nr:hypothetical protein [Methylicorpusculum oleiharenae]MCD2452775.1 hypothetical protein [Methylicorpusculum oleiharenae]